MKILCAKNKMVNFVSLYIFQFFSDTLYKSFIKEKKKYGYVDILHMDCVFYNYYNPNGDIQENEYTG